MGLEGKWKSILMMAGFTEKELNGKNGPCPFCNGKDRFRYTDKGEGMFICSHCGGGDGFRLIQLKFDYSFKESLAWVRSNAGVAKYAEVKKVDYEKNRTNINQLLRYAHGPTEHLIDYFRDRCIDPYYATDPNIAVHPKCRYRDDHGVKEEPAILAKYYGVDDLGVLSQEPVTVLRHWTGLGVKMVMPPAAEMRAVVCPVGPRVTDFLAVAEGLYTAISYMDILSNATGCQLPCWSCYSAESMKLFVPPSSVKRLHICCDVDISFTGQVAAYTLAKNIRALRPDINIRIVRPCTNDGCDYDFNDWLKEKRRGKKCESESAVEVAGAG